MEPFVFRYEGALIAAREVEQSDEVLAAVNRYTLRPLTRDEFVVFRMELCHNQVDKHHSRFPESELEKINAMVPGRPLMERHDLHGSLPRGIFFRSELRRDGEKLIVAPEVYVLRTDENRDFILNIEGGVYRETSIGFSFTTPECSICTKDLRTCDHVPGREYEGARCHYVMRDVLEVIEGSVVASGSQGTVFVDQKHRTLPMDSALQQARTVYEGEAVPQAVECGLWADE